MHWRTPWLLLKRTLIKWREDDVSRHAAALAYYTAVSVAPLLMMVVVLVSYLGGTEHAARTQLMAYVHFLLGPEAAHFMRLVIQNADKPAAGSIAGIVSVLTLIWGSTNVFTYLQTALNKIWGVKTGASNSILITIRYRFLSFAMVLVIAFLLLVSLILSTVLSAMTNSLGDLLPGIDLSWGIIDFVASFVVITSLFAAIFKILPDAAITWNDVWIGASATSSLFSLGKLALSFYLARIDSSYGAAGTLIAFLLWVYYSAQILFIGAEFTRVYSHDIRRNTNARVTMSPPQPTKKNAEQPLIVRRENYSQHGVGSANLPRYRQTG